MVAREERVVAVKEMEKARSMSMVCEMTNRKQMSW
jgi:hypothetical protein